MIRLEDVLTDEQIYSVAKVQPNFPAQVRACIALAVEKWPEKVEGFVNLKVGDAWGYFAEKPSFWTGEQVPENLRHALLLIGPKYEPKPVKSAEERIAEALHKYGNQVHEHGIGYGTCMTCEMARILRGSEEGR